MIREESYSPFRRHAAPARPREAVTVFVLARLRGDQTDSMRGALRAGPRGGRIGLHVERRAVSVAVVRSGGARTRGPGGAAGRARGRRLDAGPVSAVTA